MVRVLIFFILFIFFISGYFLIFENHFKLNNLLAESKYNSELNKIDPSIDKFISENKLDEKDRVYLVNFWATWCSTCMKELPSLNRFNSLYKKNGLKIIAVNEDYEDQEKLINKTQKDLGLDLEIIIDRFGKYTELLNINALPVTIIFKNNQILEKINGEIDFDSKEFRKKIDLLLQSSLQN